MSYDNPALARMVDRESFWSAEARSELEELGMDARKPTPDRSRPGLDPIQGRPALPRTAIAAPDVLNEAFDYALPSSFSRGIRVPLADATLLFLSGTASIDDQGQTVFPGDFKAQCLRTFRNLTRLLVAEGATWHDVVRTTCYLRDIDRDYDTFNQVRTFFMHGCGLEPLPASTGIQAHLCRPDLLVEIEAIAIIPRERGR